MKLKTFTWCTQIQGGAAQVAATNNMRSAQFGNGFIQSASSGLNTRRRSSNIVHGSSKHWREVYDFCNDHVMKPFIWTPADGRMGVFIVLPDTVVLKPVAGKLYEVTATFQERFTAFK